MVTKKDPRLTSRVFSFSAILIFVQTGIACFSVFCAHKIRRVFLAFKNRTKNSLIRFECYRFAARLPVVRSERVILFCEYVFALSCIVFLR